MYVAVQMIVQNRCTVDMLVYALKTHSFHYEIISSNRKSVWHVFIQGEASCNIYCLQHNLRWLSLTNIPVLRQYLCSEQVPDLC